MKQIFAFSLLYLTVLVNDWSWGFVVRDPGFHGEKSRSDPGRKCEVHFEMELASSDGEWECYAHYAAEDGTAVLPDNNCEKVTWFERDTLNETTIQFEQPMTVTTDESLILGHQNGDYEDFYSVLMITMTQKPNHDDPLYKKVISVESDLVKRGTMDSPPPKMCVFYIGASGPGEPVFYAHGFHNASCTLEVPKHGSFEFILTAK